MGASWDWSEYQPHVTIAYAGADVDLSEIEPYNGKLVFGPEKFAEVDENWKGKFDENVPAARDGRARRTTDLLINKIAPELFKQYPSMKHLASNTQR